MFTVLQKLLRINGDFESIFFKNEYKKLAGYKQRTILALLSICKLSIKRTGLPFLYSQLRLLMSKILFILSQLKMYVVVGKE